MALARVDLEMDALADALAAERPRLVRLCARLSGTPTAAEDLAQETLLEAWRQQHKLSDLDGVARWLAAIARNMCLRWARQQGHAAPLVPLAADGDGQGEHDGALRTDGDDLDLGLERDELAGLLERALSAVAPETRRLLVERYVEGRPQAEVAARLGLRAGTVAVRLQRGRATIRRVLAGELREAAAACGVFVPGARGWQQTAIWCPTCGARKLLGCFDTAHAHLMLRCSDCCDAFARHTLDHISYTGLFEGVSGFRPALTRVMTWAAEYYSSALAEGRAPCLHCRRLVPLRMGLPASHPLAGAATHSFHLACESCGYPENNGNVDNLVLGLPEGRRFWRAHPRLRRLPEREIEAAGQPALVVSFESVGETARLAAVVTRERYQILEVHAS